jgi:O-antigen ligase
MILSLIWTRDFTLSLGALQKEASFLFIPLAFLFLPKLTKEDFRKAFRIFSFAMVIYALYYFTNATFRFLETGNKTVFFYHELVTMDLNAIYVSVFASFALFYFISTECKLLSEKTALVILIILVFLLSSKSIITIDFLLVICYYSFFAKIPNGIKSTTIIAVSSFLLFSLLFVEDVKQRFLLEYQTAFVDNTVNGTIGTANEKVYNVSLKQAWNNNEFQQNHFFPGTALRVYQVRIFKEMLKEQNIFFTGFGLNATQEKIKEKAIQHHLFKGYGDFNFHNQYIQTFAELGFFGFLILIGMLFYNLKNGLQQKDFLHIAFAITMIILFLSESFFCRQRGVIFFITVYCMLNGQNVLKKTNKIK